VSVSYVAPIERCLALFDASLGDLPSALARLERAHAVAEARNQRSVVAQLDYDRARLLARAGRAEEARRFAESCAATAAEIGIDRLAERARSLVAVATAPEPAAPLARGSIALAKEGDVWRIDYGARSLRVRDSRGMQLLARLVERPDEEIHVLALTADESGGAGLVESNAGDVLDEKARRAYRDRVRDLDEEIEEAVRNADRGRLEKLRGDRAMLEQELSRAVGLGGRGRKDGSDTERARVNVQRRLKDAVARLAEADAAVGRYLERAVRTGTFCCYRP
jgi:hypothetical protein